MENGRGNGKWKMEGGTDPVGSPADAGVGDVGLRVLSRCSEGGEGVCGGKGGGRRESRVCLAG